MKKKILKILGGVFLSAFAGIAHAQLSLDGQVGYEDEGNGDWTLYCDDAQTTCGYVGQPTQLDNGFFFYDSNGFEWVIYPSTQISTIPPKPTPAAPQLEAEFREGVRARSVRTHP